MTKKNPLFNQIVVVGLGLIGGSLALEIKRHKLARKVVGVSRSKQNRKEALRRKAVDEVYPKLSSFVSEADLVILATPVESIIQLLREVKQWASPQALITDVGSSKLQIVNEAKKINLKQFVGGHPIAGTENSGMKSAELNLFKNKKWILTPSGNPLGYSKLKLLLKTVGAEVLEMPAQEHDQVLAAVSHLPNIIAYTLANTVGEKSRRAKNIRFAGSSLKGMTRVAASPGEMWRDVCLSNGKEISKSVADFQSQLKIFQKALTQKDSQKLLNFFELGKKFRNELDLKKL